MGYVNCYPSKKPLGSSVFLVQSNINPRNDTSYSSEKENKFPTDHSIKKYNEEYKKEKNLGIKIIDNENTTESNNSKSFFKEGIINSGIRYPDK